MFWFKTSQMKDESEGFEDRDLNPLPHRSESGRGKRDRNDGEAGGLTKFQSCIPISVCCPYEDTVIYSPRPPPGRTSYFWL